MHGKPGMLAKALGLIVAGVLAGSAVAKQKPEDTSLKESLEAQYKLAKLSGVSLDTAEGGTVLSIEKPGILGSSRFLGIPNRYRGGVLHAPDKVSLALNDASIESVGQEPIDKRPLPVGDKVYVLRIYVSVKRERITFDTVECNACNGVTQGSPYESTVEFEFPKGYLETASVSQVEDTIGQVFAIDSSGQAQQAQTGQVGQTPEQGQATAGPALTNDDIIKMVQAKLGDSLIIAKIKSSACAFDTSTDALVKLKAAGVSDAVLQAMVEGGVTAPAPTLAPSPTLPPPLDKIQLGMDREQVGEILPHSYKAKKALGTDFEVRVYKGLGTVTFRDGKVTDVRAFQPSAEAALPSACGDYASCLSSGSAALDSSQWDQSVGYLQRASSLEPSRPDAWADLGRAYMATGQYQDAVAMWDKALGLGGTLTFGVWHHRGAHYEKGTFSLSAREVSFVGANGENVFSVPPAEVSSVESHKAPLQHCWYVRMKAGGEKLRILACAARRRMQQSGT